MKKSPFEYGDYMYVVSDDITYVCKIWGFHDGNYDEYRILGCGAV
jgi:hypothetical protein